MSALSALLTRLTSSPPARVNQHAQLAHRARRMKIHPSVDQAAEPVPGHRALFTRHTLAAYLQLHVNTVDRLVKRGEIPAYRVAGKLRFYAHDIDQYIHTHRQAV